MKKIKKNSKENPKLHLKKGDKVQVISGKNKGAIGKILRLEIGKMRVFVEGANMQQKHQKPNQKNQKGGIISKEGPIHYSNVLLYSDEAKKGRRIRIKIDSDKTKSRDFLKPKEEKK